MQEYKVYFTLMKEKIKTKALYQLEISASIHLSYNNLERLFYTLPENNIIIEDNNA